MKLLNSSKTQFVLLSFLERLALLVKFLTCFVNFLPVNSVMSAAYSFVCEKPTRSEKGWQDGLKGARWTSMNIFCCRGNGVKPEVSEQGITGCAGCSLYICLYPCDV